MPTILFALLLQDPVTFERQVLTERYLADGVVAGDVDGDGKVDVVSGPYWYAGPDFKTAHAIYPAETFDLAASPTNSMFSYLLDVDGDGRLDVLRLGRVHLHEAAWFRNPGSKDGVWTRHTAFERVYGESPPFVDVDGDGKPEIVCHWEKRWGLLRPAASGPWTFRPVTAPGDFHHFYHGTGVGDVDGDGKADLVLNEGWWSQKDGEWTPHPFKFGDRGGAQIFVTDVNGDGLGDVVTALDAHGWGLAWWEQVREGGAITFRKHLLMGSRAEEGTYGVAFSQPHALAMADLDGDGIRDLVVGKRRWAHGPKGDVEPDGEPVIYWFQGVRGSKAGFVPRKIDGASGVGVQITVTDVSGDGVPDVLAASKLGVFVFRASRRR
jgi:hypothetical protein